MKSLTSEVVADNKFAKWQQWTKLIAVTFSAQAIIQLLGLVTGILIVRLLPTTEYAFYTLANTMLGTMTVLADGGISSGVMAQGGKVWQDRQKLGTVIASGLKLRKIFGMFSLLISLPILFYLLIRNGASPIASGLIVLAIIPSFFAALSDTLLETASKLHQGINKLQKNQLSAGLGRFVLMVGSLLVFPFTYIAILGNGIPRMWANIRLRKISAEYADPEQKSDPAVEKEILAIVKRSLPGAIYFCVSGQITIWLISVFGNTQSIAHVGALSRLTTVLTVFTTLFSTLVVPRFARLPEKKNLLVQRFIQIEAALFVISFIIIAIVMLFPAQVLWILGKGYSNLNTEILLLTISSCLTMLAGVTYSVLVSRGWIIKPVINLSVNILFQLILVVTMDLSKTTNVLMFSIVDFLLAFVILIIYFIYRVSKLPKQSIS
ncbi:MATE family efflux transporter [Mucilaginibacter kameinonensis]|uniref:polysaccharide biosynthesis protein n=1 Tax=Mucilaginibacter kameinonensis TaxID=452286 RepID=UPI000EF80AA9|nr:polysaccharide biosynthesis protein [Mucilaginibacter kameinonensis]